ncbi:MAG: gamma carbonic anhydrase family protein [Candidatus Helarchaeota archaeon]
MIIPSPQDKKEPKIHEKCFIAPTATIIGNVEIDRGTNIWFGSVIRCELGSLKIGKNTSIQDNTTIHVEPGGSMEIGDYVVIGHNAMVHGPGKIGNNVLIGINAVVLNESVIEDNVIIAAGAVLREKTHCESGTMWAGVPAEIVKKVDDPLKLGQRVRMGAEYYIQNGKRFKKFFETRQE